MNDDTLLQRPMTFHRKRTQKKRKKSTLFKILLFQSLTCIVILGLSFFTKDYRQNEYKRYHEKYINAMSQSFDYTTLQKYQDKFKEYYDKILKYIKLYNNKGGQNSYVPKNVFYGNIALSQKPAFPIKEPYIITSEFGKRKHPITNKFDFHTGIDIGVSKGSDIYAILPGKVTQVGENRIYGNYIEVSHGKRLKSIYNHCENILASKGAVIRQGERIATVGSTGISTGPHLHLTIMIDNNYVNPRNIYLY